MTLKIFTGYYSKCIDYQIEELTPVSIAQSMPKFSASIVNYGLPELYPPWRLLKKQPKAYTIAYNNILKNINPFIIKKKLKNIVKREKSGGVVLVCWELPSNFSHRKLVALWLKKFTGIIVKEFSVLEPIKNFNINYNNLTDD